MCRTKANNLCVNKPTNEIAMKKILFVLALLGIASLSSAQIGLTLKQVKDKYGINYTDGFTNDIADRMYYISYEEQMNTIQTGSYTRTKAMYFADNAPDKICIFWVIIEPASEANPTVNYLNKHMVRVKDMLWKDYETNLLYSLEVRDGICLTTCYVDLNNL